MIFAERRNPGHGCARKGDLPRFVDDGVRARIPRLDAEQAKPKNSDLIEDAINRALNNSRRWR